MTDANRNRAEMTYDGLDRQKRWTFPSAAAAVPGQAPVANQADYEQDGYDVLGNRTSFRKRDNTTLTYSHEGTNKLTKNAPTSTTRTRAAAGYSVFLRL